MIKWIFLLLFLAACSSEPSRVTPTGAWDGGVYTSDDLGLRFTLPRSWEAATPMDIFLLEQSLPSTFEESPVEIIMMANNHFTHANIRISVQPYQNQTPTVEQAVWSMMAQAEQLGMTVDWTLSPTMLGGNLWHTVGTSLRAMGENWYGRTFTKVQNGYVIQITVSYNDYSETVRAIMDLFSDPALEPPAPQLHPSLFGEWLWADTLEMGLIFTENGLVEFGFYADETSFIEWRVINENYLLMDGNELFESYTFHVDGDFLTLTDWEIIEFVRAS